MDIQLFLNLLNDYDPGELNIKTPTNWGAPKIWNEMLWALVLIPHAFRKREFKMFSSYL